MNQDPIVECARNFGPPPRGVSLWDRMTYWRFRRPNWLYGDHRDDMNKLLRNLGKLRRNGVVAWGRVIQANNRLFSRGRIDSVGEMVFSIDRATSNHFAEIDSVAKELASLKNTRPTNPLLAQIADYLTDEFIRVFGLPVPTAISPRLACRISSILVYRKHLPRPDRCLKRMHVPLIVGPKPPHFAMILPSRYWPESLLDWWHSDE